MILPHCGHDTSSYSPASAHTHRGENYTEQGLLTVISGTPHTGSENTEESMGCGRSMTHILIPSTRSPEPRIQPALVHEEGQL